ncbi:MAG: hypothetical protein SVQ76_01125 [Candidatus Nanohaloarchaea archaeon]|nr:hypothetical protein [Candidatus Nanohaloarchaea archaeon]
MGLFDRIKGGEEEVEIKPPSGDREGKRERRDINMEEDEEDGTEEFLLPGMEASGDDSAGSTGPSRSSSAGSDSGDLERIVEQNERIIELLEDIADGRR